MLNPPAVTPLALAAAHVLRMGALPPGDWSADSLNDMVAACPPPAEAVRMLGIPLGRCPILFHDVGVSDLARLIGSFVFEGEAPWPIFYMPLDRMEHWARDASAATLLGWLHDHGLDLQLTVGGCSTWLRGHWVVLCDARLRFLADVACDQLEAVQLLRLSDQQS
jgi:hypothetical protein